MFPHEHFLSDLVLVREFLFPEKVHQLGYARSEFTRLGPSFRTPKHPRKKRTLPLGSLSQETRNINLLLRAPKKFV